MDILNAFAVVGGCIGGIIGFILLIAKVIKPALKTRDKLKKVDNIDKNYTKNKAQDEEIKSINMQLTSLDGRVATIETVLNGRIFKIEAVLNDVADGVLVLLDNKINSSDNGADQQRALSNLKRHSKVV